jgi:hypothetical protein
LPCSGKPIAISVLAVAAVAGCSVAPQTGPEPTGSSWSAIQGGTDDTTHQFAVGVVVFMSNSQVAFCSGALLAPNLVATARHCAAAISSTQIDCSTSNFGANLAPTQLLVTTDANITQQGNFVNVTQVITPTPTPVCGDDLALLILESPIDLQAYVTPVLNPPMTDHTTYSTNITAIGYGVTTPTDTTGTTAGTRRILQNIPLECIPSDPSFQACPVGLAGQVDNNEFVATDGTCEGDSGSSAFDEKSFDQGVWESFGVLSRGGVSTDGTTCVGSIYTRFDQYAQLIISTAVQAAQLGGYSPPTWTGQSTATTSSGTTSTSSSGSGASTSASTSGSGSSSGGSSTGGQSSTGGTAGAGGLPNGATCASNSACASNNCVTADNTTYFCASSCQTATDCSSGFTCEQGYCVPTASQAEQVGSSGGGKSGCSVAQLWEPAEPVPWRGLLAGAVAAVFARRRRRR